MTLSVRMDGSQILAIAEVYRALGKDSAPAMARAINQVGAKALTEVTRNLTAQTGLRRQTIVKALKVEKASASKSPAVYIIRAGGGNISLKYFGAKETTQGVSASPLGQRQTFAGTFMKAGGFSKGRVNKPNWNGQVFRRIPGTTSKGKDKFEKILSNVYIGEQMIEGATAEAFQNVVNRDLPLRVQHEILRALDGKKQRNYKPRKVLIMAKTITVAVPEGITTHQGVVREVKLREPVYDDVLELGEVMTYSRTPGGMIFMTENIEIIREYIRRLVQLPVTELDLSNTSISTARALKGAVLNFFRNDSSEDEKSKTSPPSSYGEQTSLQP